MDGVDGDAPGGIGEGGGQQGAHSAIPLIGVVA
jgi:hypothetical protein